MKKFVVLLTGSLILKSQVPLNPDPYWSYSFDNERGLAFADINNDGYPELAIAREDTANLIFMNNSGVIDSLPSWISNDADASIGIAFGDYDQDGDLDMVIANPSLLGGRLKLYRNDNGNITQDAVWSSSSKGGMWVAWGDVDNDGDLDLASVDMLDFPALHYNNNGTLETNPSWQGTDYNIDEFCAWADINQDGWLDLVVGNYNFSQPPLRVYFNDATGNLETSASWVSQADPNSFPTGGVSAGDINKDGWIDVLTANGAGVSGEDQVNTVYYNNGGVLDSVPTWFSGDVYNSIGSVLGDIDGDGWLDWAVANIYGSPSASVYLNNNGILGTLPWNPNTTISNWNIDLGDVNRDGIVIKEDTLTGNGTRKLFYLSVLPVQRILQITIDGIPVPVTDYAVDLKSGWVTLKYTPPSGSEIIFRYEHSIDMELVVSGTYIFENTNVSISENFSNLPVLKLTAFPNPFLDWTKISFILPSSDYVSLKLFDISGRLIEKPLNSYLAQGKHSLIIDGENLKSGVYFWTLKIGQKIYKNKILKGGAR